VCGQAHALSERRQHDTSGPAFASHAAQRVLILRIMALRKADEGHLIVDQRAFAVVTGPGFEFSEEGLIVPAGAFGAQGFEGGVGQIACNVMPRGLSFVRDSARSEGSSAGVIPFFSITCGSVADSFASRSA
jgi:hypothetical protein